MMRCQSSRAPQATPPLAIAVNAVTEQATCAPINSVQKEERKGEKTTEKGRETERERDQQFWERGDRNNRNFKKINDIDRETERDRRGEGRKKGQKGQTG